MCYRFYIDLMNDKEKELHEIIRAAEKSLLTDKFRDKLSKPLIISGEVRPTDVAAVIAPGRKRDKAVFPMKWGFTLKGSKQPLVNARVETAATKPTFKNEWISHRCIIPASYYFEFCRKEGPALAGGSLATYRASARSSEWEHFKSSDGKLKTGDKYSIQPRGSTITYLCGLYRFEDEYPVFTILTREPSDELRRIHDRMPLILPEDMINDWIHPDSKPEELISYALTDMIFERT